GQARKEAEDATEPLVLQFPELQQVEEPRGKGNRQPRVADEGKEYVEAEPDASERERLAGRCDTDGEGDAEQHGGERYEHDAERTRFGYERDAQEKEADEDGQRARRWRQPDQRQLCV